MNEVLHHGSRYWGVFEGGEIVGIGFLIELGYLNGRKALGNKYDVFSLIKCETTNG